jgi:hypothetical protein
MPHGSLSLPLEGRDQGWGYPPLALSWRQPPPGCRHPPLKGEGKQPHGSILSPLELVGKVARSAG